MNIRIDFLKVQEKMFTFMLMVKRKFKNYTIDAKESCKWEKKI